LEYNRKKEEYIKILEEAKKYLESNNIDENKIYEYIGKIKEYSNYFKNFKS
jgi:hypothetical protein